MLASAARFKDLLKIYIPDLMQNEFGQFLNHINQLTATLPALRRELRKSSRAVLTLRK